MNSLEAEYSFLAPTWKLPSVATPSMYSRINGTSYSSDGLDLGPDWSLWNNTMHNSRYIPSYVPSTTVRRSYPIPTTYPRIVPPVIPSQQQQQQQQQQQNYQTSGGHPAQSRPPYYQQTNNQYGNNDDSLNLRMNVHPNNEYESYNNSSNYGQSQNQPINRGLTYAINGQNNAYPPPGQKGRVKIIDHNHQTPPTAGNGYISGRDSYNSTNEHAYSHHNHTADSNKSEQKSKPSVSNQHRDHGNENKFGYQGNNFNIHEYLYGLSEPDPGSYVDTFKHHQRRLQEEKLGRKSVMTEYKNFVQNGGFGPAFGNSNNQTYREKLDSEKKRKTYAKTVREINQHKLGEQKRVQNNNGQPKIHPAPVPKYQRAREYADKIEKPHHLQPVVRLRDPISGKVIIRDPSHHERQSITS